MKIRDATVEDLPAIVGICNSAVPARVVWFSEHDPSRRPLWVMEDEGEIIGWLSLGDFYDGRPAYHATAEIGVYVGQEHQGEGLGRLLVGEAISRASGLGIETLTAGIFAHNQPSVALFEGFGFETWARFPGVAELDGVGRDLVVLGLRLDGDSRERGSA